MMREKLYRLFGKVVAVIGAIIFFFNILLIIHLLGLNQGEYLPQFSDLIPSFLVVTALGLSLVCIGAAISNQFIETKPMVAKDGGPIHSAKTWKQDSELGLFLTSCETVVSINQESGATAHVGYHLVSAKRATCSDCVRREGKAILNTQTFRREH